jgi:putative transposase
MRDSPKGRGLVRQGDHVEPVQGFEFVKAHRADHPIATMCRVLGVSTSGYDAWQHRAPSARAQQDAVLTLKIHTSHIESRGTYGAPRVHAELAAQGLHVGRKRVARLMRAGRVQGVSRRKFVVTTTRDGVAPPAPDLVQRHFQADGPDRLWVADITYVPTGTGFLYLAVVLDAWSRRVVGWAMAPPLRTELVLAALDMAVVERLPRGRRPSLGPRLPGQYTSIAYGATVPRVRPPPFDGVGRGRLRLRCVKASSRRGSVSCSIAGVSAPLPRPGWRASNSAKAGPIRAAGIRRWPTTRRHASRQTMRVTAWSPRPPGDRGP